MRTYIDELIKENKHLKKVLDRIYDICMFETEKEYFDGCEQVDDIRRIIEREKGQKSTNRDCSIVFKDF